MSVHVDEQFVKSQHTIVLKPDADIRFKSNESIVKLLVLEGIPINEPVVQHAAFVMNTEAEIRETMLEYGKTQFGGWPWPQREFAHPKDKGRFALHADGREEGK